ncbi:beta-lactamase family protein [Rhodobacteraceae bacterium N5(2021)]|uniref:Beta-lactamase family protein n=1 Tax=Gymnodinialimonas phycosphaerae TaxID=2841589 RepID=A0A975TVY6_9RHOB|nr:serine hydrolase domain-containing protein [Gymnodinialimonas phycosphaerae]MBY4891941.1 beta-lactamase family protein [Gymnodinialimonas phycosphaerae]
MTTLNHDLQKLIDAEASTANTHSLLLAVQSGDRRVDFKGSAGAAADARFFIASVTKMFTATLILQLKDQGLIDLDTTAQSILSQYDLSDLHVVKGRAYGPQLTIRHLLHQTSGLADYYEGDVAIAIKQGHDQAYDLNDVLRMSKALPPLAAPGRGRSYYSDTNWQLLGAIIETVTGRPFGDVVQTQICAPLGLKHTSVHGPDQPAPLTLYNRSRPLHLPLSLSSMGPDGGIVSTLDDMLVFLRAYMGNALFDPRHEADVRAFNKLFFPLQYGFGLMRFKLPRWLNLFRETPELIGHSGASGSFAFHAPKEDIFLTGTFNQVDAPKRPFALMMKVMHWLQRHGDRT